LAIPIEEHLFVEQIQFWKEDSRGCEGMGESMLEGTRPVPR